ASACALAYKRATEKASLLLPQSWNYANSGPPGESRFSTLVLDAVHLPAIVDLGVLKQRVDALIDFAVVRHLSQNLQRALHRDRGLVGPVGCRQRVEDVGDRHQPRRQRNLT